MAAGVFSGHALLPVILFFGMLAAVAVIDVRTLEIPNGLVLAVAIIAVVDYLAGAGPGLAGRLLGGCCVSIPMLVLTLLIPGAFGGGDIKLMAACGLMLGWRLVLFAMFAAVLMGGCAGIFLLASGRKGRADHFAFGPFLCAGCIAALLCGDPILAWYRELLAL